MGVKMEQLNLEVTTSKRDVIRFLSDCLGIGHFMSMGLYGGPAFGVGLYAYLLYKRYYIPAALYTLWYLYDMETPHRGGRKGAELDAYTSQVWKSTRDYFPSHVIKTNPLPPTKNYLLVCHPHGLLGFGILTPHCTRMDGQFQGLKTLLATLTPLHYFPFFREYLYYSNCIAVDRKSLRYALTECGTGIGVMIVVGGTKELLEAGPGSTTVVVKQRRGFVRTALECGADLVPVFVFGENELFRQLHQVRGWTWLKPWLLRMIKLCGFPLLIPTSIVPKRRPLYTVVGSPIPVERTTNPTQNQVDDLHHTYIESLQRLFDEHKIKYGYQDHHRLHII